MGNVDAEEEEWEEIEIFLGGNRSTTYTYAKNKICAKISMQKIKEKLVEEKKFKMKEEVEEEEEIPPIYQLPDEVLTIIFEKLTLKGKNYLFLFCFLLINCYLYIYIYIYIDLMAINCVSRRFRFLGYYEIVEYLRRLYKFRTCLSDNDLEALHKIR